MLRHRFVRSKFSAAKGVQIQGENDGKVYRDRFLSPSKHMCSCQGEPTKPAPRKQSTDELTPTPLPNNDGTPEKDKMHGHQSHSRRRKRRPLHGVKSVDVTRGKTGYGFTISGQHPCVLSCIVSGSPAERAGLKPGDYLMSVNGENVSKAPHDNVVRMIGTSTGTLTLQVAENYNSSDSSDDDYHVRPKSRYPNRVRPRHVIGMSPDPKVLKEQNQNARVAQYIQDTRESRAKTGQYLRSNYPYRRQVSSASSHSSQGRAESPVDGLVHVETKWGRLSSCSASRLPDGNKASQAKSQSTAKSHSVSNLKSSERGHGDRVRPGVYPGGPARSSTRQRHPPSSTNPVPKFHVVTPSFQTHVVDYAPEIPHILKQNAPAGLRPIEARGRPMEEAEFPTHSPNIRGVVGYVGTIEMPGQDDRLQHIRNAVRRLRVEQKIHTLVLMDIADDCIRLMNTVGGLVAEYPAERIVFAGACPDDKRFFGLVMSHNPEEERSSCSCHVFMVDPDLQDHSKHAQKAISFNIDCTTSPDTQSCLEFPRNASPLVAGVCRLYRERRGGVDSDVIRSQIFAEPVVIPERHNSSSSNSHDSDSGLGFSKEDNQLNERVYIVDVNASFERGDSMAHRHNDSLSGSAPDLHHLSPDISTMPTPLYRNSRYPIASRLSSRRLLNVSSTSEESLNRNRSGSSKLNIRAMPDPPSLSKSQSNNAIELRHSADSMRRSMHKFLQARHHYVRDVPGTSSDQESQFSYAHKDSIARSCSHSSIQDRPVSAPFKQLTQGLTVMQNKAALLDVSSKLSPRAFLPFGPTLTSPAPLLRSPSAPPLTTHSNNYSSDEEFDDGSAERKMSRFDQDQNEKLYRGDGPRRFSEGFALSKRREKDRTAQNEIQKWTKTGSLRRPKNAKKVLSQSHESLIVTDADLVTQQKLLSANSVNSISGHGNKNNNSHENEVGRVAGWAVNFEKLLSDPSGIHVFTEFLKKEFSEENIIFWKICLDYKKIGDPEERKNKAKEIYDKHVSSRAAEPVNIDSQARQRCEEHLELPSPEMFDVAQQQIFQLMRQDSYCRFLRSDLYKSCLMSEIEGKPLNFLEEDDDITDLPSLQDKKVKKSGEPEVKRRRSLLPWVKNKGPKQNSKTKKNKENKDREENNNNANQKKSGFATVDLSLMSKEVAQTVEHTPHSELREDEEDVHSGNYKFCRIILPDGSSTVVCARPGQTTHSILTKLCEKRNFSVSSVDVFLNGSDKSLDLNNDISTLGSKDIILERRVLFRLDLPNNKYIGVKAKPNRSIRDVLKPVLHKYSYKIDGVLLQLSDHGGAVDTDCPTSSLDGKRVIVLAKEDVIDWSASENRRLTNGRPPPVPPRTKTSTSGPTGLDELTNKVFEDLMHGKSMMAHQFDELGILDPDPPLKSNKNGEDHRLSGLFGLLRKESVAVKEVPKTKSKNKVTFALQKSETRKRGKVHDDDHFLDLLSKMQSQRIDDQRGLARESLELPDFLQKSSKLRGDNIVQDGQAAVINWEDLAMTSHPLSIQAVEGYDLDDFDPVGPDLKASEATESHSQDDLNRAHLDEGEVDNWTIRNFKTFGSPSEKISHTDCSFSKESVIPSYDQAINYFNTFSHPVDPDFDDPMLMVRSLSDLGFEQQSEQHRSAFQPLKPQFQSEQNVTKEAPKASPEKFSSSGTDLELSSSTSESCTSPTDLNPLNATIHNHGLCESGVTVMSRKPFQSILEKGRVNASEPNLNQAFSSGPCVTEAQSQNFKNHLENLLYVNQKHLQTEKHQSTKQSKKKRMVRVNGASNITGSSNDIPSSDYAEGNGGTPKELGALKSRQSRTRNPVCVETSEPKNPQGSQVTFV